MRAISQTGGIALQLDQVEIGHLNNALNEVCNGIPIANFEAAIGLSTVRAGDLLKRLHGLTPLKALNLSYGELDALRHALTAVLAELEPWEYATSMGHEVDESKALPNQLETLAGRVHAEGLRQTA